MCPVGGEKKRFKLSLMVWGEGGGGVEILCICKYVEVVLTCVLWVPLYPLVGLLSSCVY